MYQNLLVGIKKRMIEEVEHAFLNHPAFSEKVYVSNKFPFENALQFGVILRNTSASQIRMSADNYMADLYSHVRLCKSVNFPGLAVEWVRENTAEITGIKNENLNTQVDPTNRLFFTSETMRAGLNDMDYALSPQQITVYVNGIPAIVESVNGEKKTFILYSCPPAGSTVDVEYYQRIMAPPGIFIINFIEDNVFEVGAEYIIEDEIAVDSTTGLETSINLVHTGIIAETEDIFLKYPNSDSEIILEKGTQYEIDYSLGEITFIIPLPAGYQLKASYRYTLGGVFGPYTFSLYQENHDAIPGIVLTIGRRAKKGDQQVVIVSEKRESQAAIYGGHWEINLSFAVIAKDPNQMEEMTDQVVNWLWSERKNLMEFEGITLNRVEPTGESEETFIEATGDLYYVSTVDVNVMTEWQKFVPHLYKIRHIIVNSIPYYSDTRPVMKHPTIGFERVI